MPSAQAPRRTLSTIRQSPEGARRGSAALANALTRCRPGVSLPKSTDPSRIAENARIFWFNITDEDLQRIDELDPLGQSGLDPDAIDF